MATNEIRQRVKALYEELKPKVIKFESSKIETFVRAVLIAYDKKTPFQSMWEEFLAWGYKRNVFYPSSFGKKFLWHICVYLDWNKTSRKEHDMANHMAIAGRIDETEILERDAARHVKELLGDTPEALSDEAIEDILGNNPRRPA